MIKVFHAAGWTDYSNWIPDRKIVNKLEKADLVVFEGGVDVDPEIYGEPIGSHTQQPSKWRDKKEMDLFITAVKRGIPILGICRGSQLICALNGGRLIQHQENPNYIHPIVTTDNIEVQMTSMHHQAMFPYELEDMVDYQLLAWTEGISKIHLDGYDKEITTKPFKEAEIVYFPKSRGLAIQGHPESLWGKINNIKSDTFKDTFDYLYILFDRLMNNKF